MFTVTSFWRSLSKECRSLAQAGESILVSGLTSFSFVACHWGQWLMELS